MGRKLKQMMDHWQQGTVAVLPWLASFGIYRQLADNYVRSGLLNRLSNGAYAQAKDPINYLGGLYAIQTHLNGCVHIGGLSAFQYYIKKLSFLEMDPVMLFAVPEEKIPRWFKQTEWGRRFRTFKTNLFNHNRRLGIERFQAGDFEIKISTLERAVMEVLYLVPNKMDYEKVVQLMGHVKTLRPLLVQSLLEDCTSVKVKRLFLFLAEAHHHEWLQSIDLSRVDLGSGKRVIAGGGQFHAKYQLSLPPMELIS